MNGAGHDRFRAASRARAALPLLALASIAVALTLPAAAGAASRTTTTTAEKHSSTAVGATPTIVLVHGAFADASGWSAEVRYLTRHGYPVIAPANPLRGLTNDADYIRSILATIPGPVVLVGHSYGGAVITNAARGAANVKALVYVSAFLPDAGEPAAKFTNPSNFPGSLLNDSTLLLRPITNPLADQGQDVDVYIDPASFRAVFAADLAPTDAAVLAASQRPVTGFAYYEPSGEPAWATIPSWDLVSLDDKAIPPGAQQFMAQRAHAHTTAIHSAHDSLITHPDAVDELIVEAANSLH